MNVVKGVDVNKKSQPLKSILKKTSYNPQMNVEAAGSTTADQGIMTTGAINVVRGYGSSVEELEEEIGLCQDFTQDGTTDLKGRRVLRPETGKWKACYFMLGYEMCERMAYYGISPNLFLYLTREMKEGTVKSSNNVINWVGTVWMTPIIGAYIAYIYLGRYWTFMIASIVYVMVIFLLTLAITISALKPPSCGKTISYLDCDKQSSSLQVGIFYCALLISVNLQWKLNVVVKYLYKRWSKNAKLFNTSELLQPSKKIKKTVQPTQELKLEEPRKFLIPCALQELDRTNALADSGASINLLPHSIYKQLGLEALKPTRMTLELANRSVTHPMGIAEDVVVRVDGFTFLADFVVANFEPDPRVPIILRRPFLRTAEALIDLYEEKLTLRVGSDELVFYAKKSEISKNKQFAHAISVIDFSKDEPFSGSTTNHSDTLPLSSSLVKTSDNLEEFADELTLLKKGVHEENFQIYSSPLFEFDDNFTSSNENPLFNKMDEDVENENSNVLDSDEPDLLNTPLSDKVECFAPKDDIDEIDAFLAMEVSSNFEEGYFDSEGDVIFLENLFSDDTTHNLAPEVISNHEPKQNESIHNTSITFSLRSDPLHHEFAGELITLPSRIAREHEEYLNRMTLLCEISTSRSQENVHVYPSLIIESLPVSLIPIKDSDPVQEEIDIFLVPDDLIPPDVENDDFEDEDNELPNLDHQDNLSSPRPPPEPLDVCLKFKPDTAMKNDEDFNQGEIVLSLNIEDVNSFTFVIGTFLPSFTYPEDSPVILSLRSEDLVFDPSISTFHFSLKPVPFSLPKDE
ncbi:NRT1/ PTR family protein 5.2 [Tanacetum coccineum]